MRYAKRQFGHWSKPAAIFCLIALVSLQMAMAASERLHKFFHADADDPGHECAVTMFAHGQVDSTTVDIPLALPVTGVEITPPPVASVFSASFKDLPPGRGPPRPCLAS